MFNWEKDGGSLRCENQMATFRNALENVNLHDLGFSGPILTWNSGKEDMHRICERLDKVVANDAWRNNHLNFSVKHGFTTSSDHLSLLVDMIPSPEVEPRRNIFKFETY